jgi:hypothetical protein
MILLTSFLHRETLKEIIFKWMKDELLEEDCKKVKTIINFNVHVVNAYLDHICKELFSYLSNDEPWTFEVTSKGELKDFVLTVAPYKDERLVHIAKRYKKYPEDFFLSSPFHGKVYCTGPRNRPVYLGHSRVKRFRRVAEKASRRMINIIFNQIKKRADDLAFERASRLGIPKEQLHTPIEKQVEEFAHAERRFIKELRRGMFYPDEVTIRSARIHDIAGVKAIIEEDVTPVFEDFFNNSDCFKIVEKEKHSGVYNATNYIVEYFLDKEMLLRHMPDARIAFVLAERGLNRESLEKDYETFINTAEDNVYIEFITSNYEFFRRENSWSTGPLSQETCATSQSTCFCLPCQARAVSNRFLSRSGKRPCQTRMTMLFDRSGIFLPCPCSK